jgi:hypothetical protein
MSARKLLKSLPFLLFVVSMVPGLAFSQTIRYSNEELLRRRNALMDKVGEGIIIIF